MSDKTGIEWTDATWNPVRGCTKISPGCKNCYAAVFAERWRGIPGHPYEQGFDLRLVPDKLDEPLRWKRSRRIFVNSMSDLFHEGVPNEFIADVFATMYESQWHTFQVLTKRSERLDILTNPRLPWATGMLAWNRMKAKSPEKAEIVTAREVISDVMDQWPLPNVWWGVSVENRKHGLPRVDALRQVPAAVRFLSIEPLLEELGEIDLTGIQWVIVGGESGYGARPMQTDWVRAIRDQCRAAGVPLFVKQLGGVRDKRGGIEDLPVDLRIRDFPNVQA